MEKKETLDRGYATAFHGADPSGWRAGDLDYFTVPAHVYTPEEDAVWQALYKRQIKVLQGRAIDLFMDSLATLGISQDRVPSLDEINAILMKRTGWKAVPVPGFIPDEPFFELLANRRFPVGNFIRSAKQMDYIQEPDVFHDLFGHIPILADPVFADYMEAYGKGGIKATKLGCAGMLARLYWYTVEFGLIRERGQIHIYGAGILSSPAESVFSTDSPSPNRVGFDLKRMLRTHYYIDDFQDTYFVIDNFEQMFEATKPDFTPIYNELAKLPVIAPKDLVTGDTILTRGTYEYGREAQQRREERLRTGQHRDAM
jgi:phenylalanine-4-hydroxylase